MALAAANRTCFVNHGHDGWLSIISVSKVGKTTLADKPHYPSNDPRVAALARNPSTHENLVRVDAHD